MILFDKRKDVVVTRGEGKKLVVREGGGEFGGEKNRISVGQSFRCDALFWFSPVIGTCKMAKYEQI